MRRQQVERDAAAMANALPIFFAIAAGLCLTVALYALWQSLRGLMLRGSGAGVANAPHDAGRERLLHEKQELLTAIRDVRLERDLGKVSEADFQRLEQGYRSRAREVLRELEEQLSPHRAAAQQLLEHALGRASAGSVEADATSAAQEPALRAPLGRCAQCNTDNDVDAVFCKKCGGRIRAEVNE
jgi:hypothetical protein